MKCTTLLVVFRLVTTYVHPVVRPSRAAFTVELFSTLRA